MEEEPTNKDHPKRRSSDAFIARWLRTLAYALIPALLSGAGILWADRQARETAVVANTQAVKDFGVRVTALEKRVEENKNIAIVDRREILDELKEMRKEVREMYKRASAR